MIHMLYIVEREGRYQTEIVIIQISLKFINGIKDCKALMESVWRCIWPGAMERKIEVNEQHIWVKIIRL